MAWESRKGTKIRYYYTAQKVRGRVEKVCFGSGHRAAEMARQDAQARAARAQDIAQARALEVELEPLERLTTEADEQVERLMEASLLAAGFHDHRGQWRKRHGCQSENTASER